jgi:hypothetical protein
MGKTTAKLGRMELDTPLAFSEKWSIVPNTFDAAVVINQDIPDTTLVAAYIGKGNGVNIVSGANRPVAQQLSAITGYNLNYDGGVVGAGANFHNFMNDGAYALAAINNSFKPLVAQAWYYNVSNVADAYWLQADIDCSLVKGLKIGGQYADMSPKGLLDGDHDSDGYAVKLGYAMDMFKVTGAYSNVDADGVLSLKNVATSSGQSKLYTEANWNYGYVSAPGAESYMLSGEVKPSFATFGVQYTEASVKPTGALDSINMKEVALTASKSFGPLDATVAYIYTDANNLNQDPNGITGLDGRSFDTLQVYLTLNF